MDKIIFDKTVNIDGTCLQGYFYHEPNYLKFIKKQMDNDYIRKMFRYDENIQSNLEKIGFEELVNKLSKISKQSKEKGDKVNFEFIGKYDNQIFTLYDWKDDKSIHIGAYKNFPCEAFVKDLYKLVMEN